MFNFAPRSRDTLTRGLLTPRPQRSPRTERGWGNWIWDFGFFIFDYLRVSAAGGGIEIFNFAPRLRDASPHGRDALTRAFARIAHAKAAKAAKEFKM